MVLKKSSENSGGSVIGLYRRIYQHVHAYRSHILLILVLSLLGMPLALLAPLPLKITFDSALGSQPLPWPLDHWITSRNPSIIVLWAGVLLLVIAAATLVRGLLQQMLSTYTGEKLVLDFRALLLRHAQRLSLAYHDSRGTSDSVYRIEYDAPAIQWIAVEGIIPMISALATVGGMLYVTARLSLQLALVALSICPIFLILTHVFGRRLRESWHEVNKINSRSMGVVQEGLAAVRVVKAFTREDHEHDRFVRQCRSALGVRMKVALDENAFNLLIGLTTAAATAAALYIGVRQVRSGVLTVGDLLLVMGYLAQIYAPLKTVSSQLTAQQRSLSSAQRAFALLDEAPEVPQKPRALALTRARGEIDFRQVTFGYQPGRQVLREVDLHVPAGTTVAIAGCTGAGKTTLLNLLCRFFDPEAGAIFLDGTDLRDYRLKDLRQQFAIVLQDAVLFSTSIAQNIAYARPDAGEEAIIAAAVAAGAHEFITALPQGYQTVVGERGMTLSGGERQRISLARAFLKDAPILLLDEPTSAVDVRTERFMMDAMKRLMVGRTTFMIAHRLSTLEICRLHLYMEDGQLRQSALAELSADSPRWESQRQEAAT